MKLHINEEEYEIPERLTVDQWVQLIGWDSQLEENWSRIIHIATGAPLKPLQSAPTDGLELGARLIVELMNMREPTNMKPVNELNFGEWVDIEVLISDGSINKLQSIMEILRPGTEWAEEALWVVDEYLKWRGSVYKSFSNLFGLNDQLEEDEEEELEVSQDPLRIARSWYNIIIDLADWDLLKIDRITEEPVIKVLNFMAAKKEKQMAENAQIKQQQRQHDIQRTRR